MTTIFLVLLAVLTLAAIFTTALFTIAVLDRLRELLKAGALDAVQVYAAAHTAKLDAETRREELQFTVLQNTAKLEHQMDYGRLMLAKQRQQLSGPVESQVNP